MFTLNTLQILQTTCPVKVSGGTCCLVTVGVVTDELFGNVTCLGGRPRTAVSRHPR